MTVQLYCGDCLEIMRGMADKSVDAVITDPQYGIANVWKGGFGHGWAVARMASQKRNEWDLKPPSKEYFKEIFRISKNQIIWGGNYFDLPISRGWLVWNKPERGFSLSEAELAWTSIDMPMRVFDCHRSDYGREHPTQKPLSLMKWCIDICKLPNDAVIFDPFLGSGTTLVAALQLGYKNLIGAERESEYFAIAQRRIAEAQLQPMLFDHKEIEQPKQGELL